MTDSDSGTLVAAAVVESLAAVLAESDGAAVALALKDTAEDAVARPVPTIVGATEGDGSTEGDASPLTLLEMDADVDALSPELALTPWEVPPLGDA